MSIETDIDREAMLWPIFGISTAVSLGLLSGDAIPLIDLSRVVVGWGGVDWSIARLLSVGILLILMINRDRSLSETNGFDLWALYATVALVITPPFVPVLEEILLAETLAAVIAWIAQSYGFAIITMVN